MTASPEFGAAIEVNGKRFGDEIPLTDGKPHWLSDDMEVLPCSGDDLDGHSRMWSCPYEANDVKVWPHIEAIRLEVPRYDFVYLALERGMVPWFGGDEAPGDWDALKPILFRNGETCTDNRWHWEHSTGFADIIGYKRKATSTALPLAHPPAPQGEEDLDARKAHIRQSIIRQLGGDNYADRVILDGTDWDIILAALAPAAIASGREGAE